jgi:peptidoglycan hydrolase CwlO-like protein
MPDLDVFQKLGIGGGSFAVIAYVIWQSWIKVRQQMKEDSKGDKIDQRIDAYSDVLQKTIDKLVTKIENLQNQNNDLVTKAAQLSAELIVAHKEIDDLQRELNAHIVRIRYLEQTLKDHGVEYAQQS